MNSKGTSKAGGAATGTERWQATCPVCQSANFTSKEDFRKHVNTHPRCGKCDERFTSNTALGAHSLRCQG